MFGVQFSLAGGQDQVAHELGTERFSHVPESVTVVPQPLTEDSWVKSAIALRSMAQLLPVYFATGWAYALNFFELTVVPLAGAMWVPGCSLAWWPAFPVWVAA